MKDLVPGGEGSEFALKKSGKVEKKMPIGNKNRGKFTTENPFRRGGVTLRRGGYRKVGTIPYLYGARAGHGKLCLDRKKMNFPRISVGKEKRAGIYH